MNRQTAIIYVMTVVISILLSIVLFGDAHADEEIIRKSKESIWNNLV